MLTPGIATATSRNAEPPEAYLRDGFVAPIRVLSDTEARVLRTEVEALAARPVVDRKTDFRQSHLIYGWADRLVRHPSILDAVEDVLGPNILVWRTNFFVKPPSSPQFVSWHQDATYWDLEPAVATTAWLALSDCSPQNGCVRVIPGSHRWGLLPHVDRWSDENMLSRGQTADIDVDEDRAVDLALHPGEMSLHDAMVLHGSPPNRAEHPRIGIGIICLPTYVKQRGTRSGAVLVRGVDTHRHFIDDPRPSTDLSPEALAARERSLSQQASMLGKRPS